MWPFKKQHRARTKDRWAQRPYQPRPEPIAMLGPIAMAAAAVAVAREMSGHSADADAHGVDLIHGDGGGHAGGDG